MRLSIYLIKNRDAPLFYSYLFNLFREKYINPCTHEPQSDSVNMQSATIFAAKTYGSRKFTIFERIPNVGPRAQLPMRSKMQNRE